jgi:hypothetical protein
LPEPQKPAYLKDMIADAAAHGASVINENGGEANESFVYPAIVYPVNRDMKLYTEEQFGPVIPVVPFDDLEETIQYLIDSTHGQQVSIFSNSEEELSGLNEKAPFLLESKLKSLGALYSKGPDFTSYVVADDNIITGQNPASSIQTAKLVLTLAHGKKKLRNLKASEKSIRRSVSDDRRIY